MARSGAIVIEEINYNSGGIVVTRVPADAGIEDDKSASSDISSPKDEQIDCEELNFFYDNDAYARVHVAEVDNDNEFAEFTLSRALEDKQERETNAFTHSFVIVILLLVILAVLILLVFWTKENYRRRGIRRKSAVALDLTRFSDNADIMHAVANYPESMEFSIKVLANELLAFNPKSPSEFSLLSSKLKSSKATLDHVVSALRSEATYCKEIGDAEGYFFLANLAYRTWEYHRSLIESSSRLTISRNKLVGDVMMKALETSEVNQNRT
jgi:hypothetical protein